MKYNTTRSLCFNIAQAIGMNEADMRLALNAKSHVKEVIKSADHMRFVDYLQGENGQMVIISLMVWGTRKEYSISTVSSDTIDDIDWEEHAANSFYFIDDGKEGHHMKKIEALICASYLMGGEMSKLENW